MGGTARALVVLHVEGTSGPERSLLPRLASMRETGTELTFLVPASGSASESVLALGDVETGIPGASLFPTGPAQVRLQWQAMRSQRRLVADAVRRTRSEIAIVSSPTMIGALHGARRAGAGTVLYCGEVLSRGGIRTVAGSLVGRLAARRADVVVAASRMIGDWYQRLGASVRVVHPPISAPAPPEQLKGRGAALRAELRMDPDAVLVASLGAITEGRGQHLLVRALHEAVERDGEWRLAVGGAPYDRPRDRAYAARLRDLIAELDVTERVHLIGAVEDPSALYAAADLFVNPAQIPEGFGRAACEALAAGCPVVSTRVGGVSEALRDGETALLVEPGSAAALAAGIDRLLGNPELAARLASAGAADVERRFAPAVGQPAFEDALELALSGRGVG